ncbi:MAG: membrane protein [Microgenomates group bacterium ADurb.Bin238]|nr:MAG: membrane protein [Microgenomates group bacterium ADurb.Bin238]
MKTKDIRIEVGIAVGLLLLVLIVFKALLQPGFYESHDGLFHLIRVEAMAHELSLGQFPVRMAGELAYGRGYPVFNYAYPLFHYFAAGLVLLGLTAQDAIKVVVLLCSWLSVWAGYKWMRCFFEKKAALTGAVLLLLVPYRFLITLVIGSFGTILAWAMAMVVLWAMSEVMVKQKEKYLGLVSLGVAGLIPAHNVTALIFAPVIAIYGLALARWYKTGWFKLIIFGLLGVVMAAWFWLPAIAEMDWVALSNHNAVDYQQHWPTLRQVIYSRWGYGYSESGDDDGMSFMLGITQWVVFGLSVIALMVTLLKREQKKEKTKTKMALVFGGVVLLGLYLMLPMSEWLWQKVIILTQIQFPWRWLVVSAVGVSFLAAWLVEKSGWWMMVLLLLLAGVSNRNITRTLTGGMQPLSKWEQEARLQPGSTDIAWEALPKTASQQNWQVDWQIRGEDIAKLETKEVRQGERGRWSVEMENEGKVEISKYYLPLWQVEVNGEVVESKPSKDGGYIEIELPSGANEVVLTIRQTNIEKGANIMSVIGGAVIIFWLLMNSFKFKNDGKR